MNYYLSYVERKGHAAVLLSVQKSPTEPVEVFYEFGLTAGGDYNYFNTVQGVIVEENNASRGLYHQSSHVKHRTYPISQSDRMERCSLASHTTRFEELYRL